MHDSIAQKDIEFCIARLVYEGYIELDISGDADSVSMYNSLLNGDDSELDFDSYMEDFDETDRAPFFGDINTIKYISLSDGGIESVNRRIQIKTDVCRSFARMDDDATYHFIENILSEYETLEPVRYRDSTRLLDFGSIPKELRQATIENIDRLQNLIKQNNEIMSRNNQEVKEVLISLGEGKKLIESGSVVSIGKIEGIFYGALAYLAAKFADAPIGEAASVCWGLVKNLIARAV